MSHPQDLSYDTFVHPSEQTWRRNTLRRLLMNNKMNQNIADRSAEVRHMIDRENDLINYRITWLTTINGLLFAALGFSWDKPTGSQLIQVICALGFVISLIQLAATISANMAIARLVDWWENNKPKDYDGPGVMGFQPIRNRALVYLSFLNWIPFLFMTAWGFIFYIVSA